MARLYVRHDVADYDAWRKVYDDFGAFRRQHGVTAAGVHRNVENGNDITVFHDFGTVDEAKALIDSAELKDAMARAGVVMPPTAWITEEA